MKTTVQRLAGIDEIASHAASIIASLAEKAIGDHGFFSLVLSGGSTPRTLYRALAEDADSGRLPRERIHLFWGDERCVAPGHRESNYRMAQEALLSRVSIPSGNIHRIRGELGPGRAALLYEREITNFFGGTCPGDAAAPTFDLVLLGVGDDGHTASLFPGDGALEETGRLVTVTVAPHGMPVRNRVTMTLPLIGRAARVMFLVSGERKKSVLRAILHDDDATLRFPAARVKALEEVLWLVDMDV